ncbi:MAG TPA: LiaF domain-containing protein [Bacillota bacterium]|nr:LiaF domain-containing protein [Bacillota bacterium]
MNHDNRNYGLIPLGIILILAGVLVFLANLGYGSWEFLWQIWRFWPVLIILIGVKLLLPRQVSRWVSYGFWIIVGVALIVMFLTTPKTNFERTELGGQAHYVINRTDYPGVTTGKADLSFGGGQLVIGSLTNEWLEGDFGGWAAKPLVRSSLNTLNISLKQSRRFPGTWRLRGNRHWNERDYKWDLNLSPELDWDLNLQTGAMKGAADLSGLRLRELSVKMGAGDLDLTLGNPEGNTPVTVDAGASNIKIRVPEGAAVKVKISGALVKSNLHDLGLVNNNRTYTSPGYDQAANHVDITLNMAVGNFELLR